jgi:DNA-binding transcriptional MerR regulator
MTIRRVNQGTQLDLFDGATMYVSQADAASALGLSSARIIQYWESQGLLHPELPAEGRNRRYTKRDLVELRFIKSLVVDQGYTLPALKEKLKQLKAPYDYNSGEILWDPKAEQWKSRQQMLAEQMQELRPELDSLVQKALEGLLPKEPSRAAGALLDLIRDVLSGRAERPRARARRKALPKSSAAE